MNWKKSFAIHILERGYDYYLENAVENLDVSDDIIRVDVMGSEDYEVEISLSNGEVTDTKHETARLQSFTTISDAANWLDEAS